MDIEVKSEDASNKRLNSMVGITVVIFAVFMAVRTSRVTTSIRPCRSEGGMVDAWTEYQAARIKLHVDENGLSTLRLLETTGQVDKALAAKQAAEYEADIKKYQERSKETRAKAERLEKEYEELTTATTIRPVGGLPVAGDRDGRHRRAGRAELGAVRRLGRRHLLPRPAAAADPAGVAARHLT